MKILKEHLRVAALATLLCGLAPGVALADAQINFGDTWLGVNDEGHLNVPDLLGVTLNTSDTGLTFQGNDATSPGCLCEGWGVAVNGTDSMYATVDNDFPGVSNVTLDSFGSDASSATSVVTMTSMPGLTVTHAYAPSAAGNVFEAVVTIANNTGADVTDVRYTRAMDWDIAPDEFNEFVTIGGTDADNLLFSSDNGFATPDPLDVGGRIDIGGCPISADFTDCGPTDHGALFDFGFGDLADGEELSFSIFYGGAEDEAGAIAALATIGAELFSFGQWSGDPMGGTPATYLFAFTGVGGDPVVGVPAPSSLLLMGLGLIAPALRRRKSTV